MSAAAAASSHGRGSSDCVHCQRLTSEAFGGQSIDTSALYNRIKHATWSITKDDDWQLLVAVLGQSGFMQIDKAKAPGKRTAKHGPIGESVCSILPSRVTMVSCAALDMSLKGWLAFRDQRNSIAHAHTYSERTFVLVQFVVWLSSNSENRRVLLHHGILLCIFEALAAMREGRVDLLSDNTHKDNQDVLLVDDIRTLDWGSALRRGCRGGGPSRTGRRTSNSDQEDTCVLFQHIMHLCVSIFDPDKQFAEHLRNATVVESISDFSVVDMQEASEGILAELLCIWRRLETAPSRAHFSSAIVALCCATGSILVSGRIDSQQAQQLGVLEAIAPTLLWLHIDEAYVAWRLLVVLELRYPELSGWRSSAIRARINGLWDATSLQSSECLRLYNAFVLPEAAMPISAVSSADRESLNAIFSTDRAVSIEGAFANLQCHVGIHEQAKVGRIESCDLKSYVEDTGDINVPDTRLRRSLDTLVALLAQSVDQVSVPPFIRHSLAEVHRLFLAYTAVYRTMDQGSGQPDAVDDGGELRNVQLFVLEYVRFLWSVWRLPLQPAIVHSIFVGMSIEVWDRLLSLAAISAGPVSALASAANPSTDMQPAAGVLQRLFTLCGWLLTRSAPSGSSETNRRSILEPHACKLIFSRMVSSISALAMRLSLHADPVASLSAFFAAQGLALVSWSDVSHFRSLLHETQCAGFIITALYHMDRVIEKDDSLGSPGIITQSIGDLSVVSLPEETGWDISESRAPANRMCWAEQLTAMIMFLVQSSVAESADGTRSTDGSLVSLHASDAADPGQFCIVWQTCHSAIQRQQSSSETISCLSALTELGSSKISEVAQFSKYLATTFLSWHIISALSGSDAVDINVDVGVGAAEITAQERNSTALLWSAAVLQWLVPEDLSRTAAVRQHARFIAHYRESLERAALALGQPKSCEDIRSFVTRGSTMDDLLSLMQLVATLDPSHASIESSVFSSFADEQSLAFSDSRSDVGEHIGNLIGETIRLIAFLIHGSSRYTGAFSKISGYQTVHSCVARIIRHRSVSRLPVMRGVLALLSGSMDPSNCRALGLLRIDHNWIATATAVFTKMSVAERIPALRFVSSWCEESSRAQWYWSQGGLVRHYIERMQLLLTELSEVSLSRQDRHACAVGYTKSLGRMLVSVMRMSTCASDLKLVFRTLVSGPGPLDDGHALALEPDEITEYTAMVRHMLSLVLMRCARSPGSASYFSFDGRPALIQTPHFRRIPERGFTFAAWIRPDKIVARNDHNHLLAKQSFSTLSSLNAPRAGSRKRLADALSMLLSGGDEPRPTLATVLCLPATSGNELVISHDYVSQGIEMQVMAGGTSHSLKCAEGSVTPGRWHLLAVCYAPPKRGWSPFGSSNLHIYVDGVLAHKSSIPFIDHSAYQACLVGGSPGTGQSYFSGRISAIRMFDGPLKSTEVELLYHLGPAHSSQLRKSQAFDPSVSIAALNQTCAKPATASLSDTLGEDLATMFRTGDLSSRLIACLVPDATDRSICLDLSPIGISQSIVRKNITGSSTASLAANVAAGAIPLGQTSQVPSTWENAEARARLVEAAEPWQMHGDVLSVTATGVHRALHSLGGLEVTLVLLYHLDWIGSASPPAKEGPLGSEESTFDQRTLDCAPLPSYFYWLRDLVRGHPWHLMGVRALNLVGLIGRTLQQQLRDPEVHLTMAALRAMQAFQTALDEQGGLLPTSYPGTSQLWSQVQHDLILNFGIWRRADVATQSLYLKEVHRALCLGRRGDRAGRRCNASSGISNSSPGSAFSAGENALGVRWILYALFNYYPYDSSQHISQQQQQQQQQQQSRARASGRPLSTRASVLVNEATTRYSSPSPIDGDRASASNVSFVASSDDGLGFADNAEDDLSGEIPGFPALTRVEVKQLRRGLLHTLELFLSTSDDHSTPGARSAQIPDPTKADVANLVRHLLYACNRDTEHTKEILQLLFRCLADGSPNAGSLASKLMTVHGFDVLCHIIECDDDSMAAEAINIVVLLLTMSVASREQESTTSRITNSLRGRIPVVVEPEDIARVLALVRMKRALTPALYRSLLSLALRDHVSLLASINIALPAKGSSAGAPVSRRAHHVRNLSMPQGLSDPVYTADNASVEAHESFVGPLPSRLIQVGEAWSVIMELSCASSTDPAIRVVVMSDLHRLLDDEPANYDCIHASHISLLSHLVLAVVLSGYISDRGDVILEDAGSRSERLADAYTRASNQLELLPHTTLDHHTQGLAAGHDKARKAWIQRRISQIRRSKFNDSIDSGVSNDQDYSEESFAIQAKAELMGLAVEWFQAATSLIQTVAWSQFRSRTNYADHLHRSIVMLWAHTPTGSVPLAVQLFSRVIARARSQLSLVTEPAGGVHTSEWVLPQNLAAFASNVLDTLLNYRQFQEYVAYYHEQLKAPSSGPAPNAMQNAYGERDTVYRSQNSPWDDTPELTRDLAEFMLQLSEYEASLRMPMCGEILRLALSGVRSMNMQRVEESLSLLIRLLERHPSMRAGPRSSETSFASGNVCRGTCSISHLTFATLGYIHEAYMFTDDQTISENPVTNNGSSSSSQADVRDRIGDMYLIVFQCYFVYLQSICPRVFISTVTTDGRQSGECPSSRHQFAHLLQLREWQDFYRARLMPAMRSMEEDEMRQATSSLGRFSGILRELLVQSHKTDSAQVRATKSAQTSVASNTLPIEAEETTRVKADGVSSTKFGHWTRRWRHRLRALSAPRGPWRSESQSATLPVPSTRRWMLDIAENSHRMRRRLIRNAHYEDHYVAANRRDRTGQRGANRRQPQSDKELFDSDEGILRLSLSISGTGDGRSIDGDEEWSIVTSEDLGVVAAAAVDPSRAHFSVAGERIVMLTGVCGRIELTHSQLRFTVERDRSGEACLRGSEGSTSSRTGMSSSSGKGTRAQSAAANLAETCADNSNAMPRVIHAELNRDFTWLLADIQQVHLRRYMLRSSAVEVFFRDRTSVFFNVPNKKGLMQLIWKLSSLSAVNGGLALSDVRSPPALLSRLKLTERWQHGEMSNFDYIMALNTVAGRSYSDLSQYPVFPWIISNYTSKWLDLSDPKIYRDLSRPIGALNAKRLSHFIERYDSFEDPSGNIKKFHYGTHYSSAASVAYYLIRLEPFVSVHVALQSGKFDHADRQFHSISDAWNSCMTGPGDVKELVPEFFYMPEFLVNHNGIDLGKKQDGTRLGDVQLPPWASTPEEFVSINRQALESEYVSANLHKWVDLIFGYKQRGPEAAKAHNVFYYLTYEGAVNLDTIQDPVERASVESQINYFGQTPTQLFVSPHLPRHAHLPLPLYTPLTSSSGQVKQFVLQASNCDITFVGSPQRVTLGQSANHLAAQYIPWPSADACLPASALLASTMAADAGGLSESKRRTSKETITVVDASGRVSVHQLTLFTSSDYKFQLTVEPLVEGHCVLAAACPPSNSQRQARAHWRPGAYAVVPNMPELLVSCVHADRTVRCTRIAGEREGLGADPLQRSALVSAMTTSSHNTSMTNAFAGAVVGAMSGSRHDGHGVDSSNAVGKPKGLPPARPFSGLFGGGAHSSSGNSHIGGNEARSVNVAGEGLDAGTASARDGSAVMSAPPSVFIPLAARLLDSVNAVSCVYMPDELTCVSVGESGTCAVVGSSQGTVSILGIDLGGGNLFGPGADSSFAVGNGSVVASSASVPLMFASGLADPMNPEIGNTSMAAYSGGIGIGGANGGNGHVPAGAFGSGGNSGRCGRWGLKHVLHGHDAAVLDVSINSDHDTVASASADGTVILWAARSGQYLRTLIPVPTDGVCVDDSIPAIAGQLERYSRIERVLVSSAGLVLCYSVSGSANVSENRDKLDPARVSSQNTDSCASGGGDDSSYTNASEVAALHVYNLNGRHLRTRKLVHHLRDIAVTRDGRYGACVSSDSRVAVFDWQTLGVVRQFELPACGCSVAWSGASEQQLIVGCEGGRLVVISADLSFIH